VTTYMEALEALHQMVAEARGVPLSASAVIPREEALKLIQAIRESLPQEHQQAREIVDERERVLSEANDKAAFIIEQAREERSRLLSRAEVVQAAEKEAQRVVSEATAESDTLKHQADDYVDAKLANFEIIMNKMLRTVGRGREQLRRRLDAAADDVEPLELDDSGEISGPFDIDGP
jgi:cell division septum initiation protein DivIVA